MRPPLIIGLCGRARAGKDSVADRLCSVHRFKRAAFADSLKDACAAVFGLSREQLYGDLKEVADPFWGDTPRSILQRVGTECLRRGYREDVWIRSLERRVRVYASDRPWVITDVRFPNEADAVKAWGGIVVWVYRPKGPQIATSSHASETAREGYPCDRRIDNVGTLEDLAVKVDDVARWCATAVRDGTRPR